MSNQKIRNREKCCSQCYAYIPYNSRRCKFCGYKYKSKNRHFFDRIKHALTADQPFSSNKTEPSGRRNNFLTLREVENLFSEGKFRIPMYLILDDIAFLDEMALIQLGETLSALNEI